MTDDILKTGADRDSVSDKVRAPTRLGDFLWLGIALSLAWIIVGAIDVKGTGDDWSLYLDAGRHVGSINLLTEAHFVYTPAAAWAMFPFAHAPLVVGYYCYVAIMVALSVGAAWLAARTYGISLPLATLMALAWFPLTIAICLGQNSPIALFLTMAAIFAVAKRDDLLSGVAVGLLLYKPNDAIPFLVLFVILKQWRSLAIATASIPLWYVLSVAATGDWLWPLPFSHMFTTWYQHDAAIDAVFSINIPGVLLNAGVPSGIAVSVGLAAFLLTIPLLTKVSRVEAASIVPLVGIACSPHAYGYEAILALPTFWFVMSKPSLFRNVAVLFAYCVAPLYLFARPIHFDVLAVPVIGVLAIWIFSRLRLRLRSMNQFLNHWDKAPKLFDVPNR